MSKKQEKDKQNDANQRAENSPQPIKVEKKKDTKVHLKA
jgi:hypothetical protein